MREVKRHWAWGVASLLFVSIIVLLIYYAGSRALPGSLPLDEHAHHGQSASDPSFFSNLLKVYTPRRVCMFYERPVIWLHLISDFLIGIAYYSIPVALGYFVARRKDVAFHWMFWMFALFILACGTTHLIGVLDLWLPLYRIDGMVKALTALCSIATAIALWPLIPQALALPSPSQLELIVQERTADLADANQALRREIEARARIEQERKDLLERERHARSDAERANRMKDEFLTTLSHELRTPLNAILGWAGLLRRNRDLPENFAKGIEVVERNAKAQAGIVEDLLDMSRIISGKMTVDLRHVDLAAIVESAGQVIKPAAEAKGLTLLLQIRNRPIPLRADPGRIQQAIWNLLSNAVKFTPRGGTIEVTADRETEQAVVRVRDTGEGIDAAFLPHLFERFRQFDSSTTRRHGGLGIGLSIVQYILDMHGGTITASSEGPGKGTEFVMRLPIAERGQDVPPQEIQPPDTSESQLAGCHILAVDDDPDALDIYVRILSEAGARVTTASGGAQALGSYDSNRPDLVICDIGMPGMDGYELLRRLRALEHEKGLPEAPVLAITAYARRDDTQRALAAGFSSFLAKPVDLQTLPNVIALLLRRRTPGD